MNRWRTPRLRMGNRHILRESESRRGIGQVMTNLVDWLHPPVVSNYWQNAGRGEIKAESLQEEQTRENVHGYRRCVYRVYFLRYQEPRLRILSNSRDWLWLVWERGMLSKDQTNNITMVCEIGKKSPRLWNGQASANQLWRAVSVRGKCTYGRKPTKVPSTKPSYFIVGDTCHRHIFPFSTTLT